MEFYNSDGSTSGACGNGTRCVAYLLSKEMNKDKIILETKSGNLESKILGEKLVETKIGLAKTKWDEIPLSRELNTSNLNYKIIDKNNKEHFGGTAVNVGNPHIVFFINNIEDYNLEKIGPEIEKDKLFPEKCNVTLAKIINENHIKVKVWERGAGLTKACGTAACATAYAAKINGKIENKTEIEFELGKLSIFIDESKNISMSGPVSNIDQIDIKI
jgi:diaminopimelate epimerase